MQPTKSGANLKFNHLKLKDHKSQFQNAGKHLNNTKLNLNFKMAGHIENLTGEHR
jgi:hypothetical protein